jgi:hypothetical protein
VRRFPIPAYPVGRRRQEGSQKQPNARPRQTPGVGALKEILHCVVYDLVMRARTFSKPRSGVLLYISSALPVRTSSATPAPPEHTTKRKR